MQQQQRLIIALLISAVILFGFTFLQRRFFPAAVSQGNTNSSVTPQQATGSPSQATPSTSPVAEAQPGFQPPASQDDTPRRTLLIKTPLYETRLDTRGAVATSWIVKKNLATGRDLYAANSTKDSHKELELIPPAPPGLNPDQIAWPLQLAAPDQGAEVNQALASRNYKVSGADNGDTIEFSSGEKRLDFTLHNDATGLDVTKSITFRTDRYNVDLRVKLTRNNQPVPQATLIVGPSIGDQNVSQFTFYSVAPEGVAEVNGEVARLNAAAVHKNDAPWLGFGSKRPEGADLQILSGTVNWAAVGDTYFAMVAIPSKPLQGLEYKTVAYQHEVNGTKEERYLITGFVPIPADDSLTEVYVGPKDQNVLTRASQDVVASVGRPVDLEGLLNYGFFSSIRRPLARPILWSINGLQKLTGSYGLAIILFTIFIYSLFFPLKWRSSRSMKKAQKLAPRMKELQEKIKGMKQTDPRLKELQMEQLRLMKEGNPLGGCLPLLIQMPFLFALYSAITISIDFRQATFLWIPDLSSAEPYFLHLIRILPVLFAGSMIVLQLMTPQPAADPLQRKMMAIGMPLFMLYVLWSAPAGLLVYWLVGNVVGFSQQFLINYLSKSSEDDGEPPKVATQPKRTKAKKLTPAGAS